MAKELMVHDAVFRNIRLTTVGDMDLIAFQGMFTNIRILADLLSKHVKEEDLKAYTKELTGREMRYIDFENAIGGSFHTVRAKLLSEAENLSEEERRFFKVYHKLTKSYQEFIFKSFHKVLTPETIDAFYSNGLRMQEYLTEENTVMARLVGTNDERGQAMLAEYKGYLRALANKSQEVYEAYHNAHPVSPVLGEVEPAKKMVSAEELKNDNAGNPVDVKEPDTNNEGQRQ